VEEPLYIVDDLIHVSPNPFSSSVTLYIDLSKINPSSFSILDANGRLIMTRPLPRGESQYATNLDLDFLPAGIYYLTMPLNGKQIVKKLVKE
ncbi:MAG TPA: T9SS type A sorting domain-containing protein, partial [Saprospiraceae bacterium]|nr:T9SS type A sorting domain-containing protein [Saprospiraceae bacterium]